MTEAYHSCICGARFDEHTVPYWNDSKTGRATCAIGDPTSYGTEGARCLNFTAVVPAPSTAPHELATGVLLAIRIEDAIGRWVDDDTARSLGEAIADELATPAGHARIEAFYAELDATGSTDLDSAEHIGDLIEETD